MREPNQQNLAFVHHPSEIEFVFFLSNDVANNLRAKECVQPCEQRGVRLPLYFREFVSPVIPNFLVPDCLQKLFSERPFNKESLKVKEAAASTAFQKSQDRVG